MKLHYYPETDSLYIDLSHKPSVDSREVSDGIVLDYDESGNLVGIDIDHASMKMEINEITLGRFPLEIRQGCRACPGLLAADRNELAKEGITTFQRVNMRTAASLESLLGCARDARARPRIGQELPTRRRLVPDETPCGRFAIHPPS